MKVLLLTQGGTAASDQCARLTAALKHLPSMNSLLVLGEAGAAEPLRSLSGVERLLHAEIPEPILVTRWARSLAQWIGAQEFSHILMASDSFGKDLLPHLAALLDRAMVSEVVAIESSNRVIRASHAGAVWQTVESQQRPLLMTLRTSAFAPEVSGTPLQVERVTLSQHSCGSEVLSQQALPLSRPRLHSAEIVIGVGRGVASAQMPLIEALADQLGAAIGGSRGAVDLRLVDNAVQIGQSGAIIAPRLYIAVGISGADQHLAGIKDAGIVVAIDTDEQTPLMQWADYALQGDISQCLPDLIALLKK
ncbi:electron transfer flavoprotein subunit alpha/FixB family protein [Ferrimonas gelatinilytica]|uniref:FAD-binding protein n=1 Tax=Ferrimonas gelatinilytica TaxID=1255257 RepID=A0ABP9S4H7_9GAMM